MKLYPCYSSYNENTPQELWDREVRSDGLNRPKNKNKTKKRKEKKQNLGKQEYCNTVS